MSTLLNFVLYDSEGRITSTQRAPEGILLGQLLEVPEWRDDYDLTHYVENGEIHQRPVNPALFEGKTLSSLPSPCVITINGVKYECTDTTAKLDFTYPSVYNIVVEAFPYLTAHFNVTIP